MHVSGVRALVIRMLIEGTHRIRALHLGHEAVPSRDSAAASPQQSECLSLLGIAGPPHHSRGWPVPCPVPPVMSSAHQQACSTCDDRDQTCFLSGEQACPMVTHNSAGPWKSSEGHSSELWHMCKLCPTWWVGWPLKGLQCIPIWRCICSHAKRLRPCWQHCSP